jgi:putative hemolysin
VIGIAVLESWDLMDPDVRRRTLASLTKPAHFVWPGQIVEELIPELAARDDRMAVVVDEYGSAIGIVTLEDIIGHVVGDVNVGFDRAESSSDVRSDAYQEIAPNHYLFDARCPISEINELLGVKLPTNDVYTIGGLVVGRLRHLPGAGEAIVESGFRFTVEEATEWAPVKIRAEAVS